MDDNRFSLRLIAPGLDFLLPYVSAAIPEADLTGSETADRCVAIAPVADAAKMRDLAAHTPVLLCPGIVGTGMTGFPFEVASAVFKGRFYHTRRSDNPISLIHALDVAAAVRLVLGKPGLYTITDGAEHTLGEFAEALARRMGDRRILRHRTAFTRLLLGDGLGPEADAPVTADGSDFAARFDFHPHNVTEYLRTHVYDQTDI